MPQTLVFRTGWLKKVVGWCVVLGAASAMAAMIQGVMTNWQRQTTEDLWSAVVLSLFLIGLMVLGVAVQYRSWSAEGEIVTLHGLFRSRTTRLSELAGFGTTTVIVLVFPLVQIDLYDDELRPVLRLPVRLEDVQKAESWFARRLRRVVNDGSAALPKRRFVDP